MFDYDRFYAYEQDFLVDAPTSFMLKDGVGNLLVSAPHSVPQTRDGKIKRAEEQTGPFALMLHDELNCPIIYKTANLGDDANHDTKSDYKQAIVEYISTHNIDFVLDLHLMSAKRDIMVDICTGEYANVKDRECVEVVKTAFLSRGFVPVEIDKPFAAKNIRTVSAYVAKHCDISCLQLEINSRAVYTAFEEARPADVYEALKEIVIKLRNTCKK